MSLDESTPAVLINRIATIPAFMEVQLLIPSLAELASTDPLASGNDLLVSEDLFFQPYSQHLLPQWSIPSLHKELDACELDAGYGLSRGAPWWNTSAALAIYPGFQRAWSRTDIRIICNGNWSVLWMKHDAREFAAQRYTEDDFQSILLVHGAIHSVPTFAANLFAREAVESGLTVGWWRLP